MKILSGTRAEDLEGAASLAFEAAGVVGMSGRFGRSVLLCITEAPPLTRGLCASPCLASNAADLSFPGLSLEGNPI